MKIFLPIFFIFKALYLSFLNKIKEANFFGLLICIEIFRNFNNLYTSLKLSIFGPCKILAPERAASKGFCPPLDTIDPPKKTDDANS